MDRWLITGTIGMKRFLSLLILTALFSATGFAQGGEAHPLTPKLNYDTPLLSPKSVVTSGDTISYCGNSSYATNIGYSNSSDHHAVWGIMIPAADLSGRNYLKSVMLYIYYAGTYTMRIYTGGTSVPSTLIHTQDAIFATGTTSSGWNEILLDTTCYIGGGDNLWVCFETYNINYPASACTYAGDANSDLITNNLSSTSWAHAISGSSYSWLIKAVTSATMPALPAPIVSIFGPTALRIGDTGTYTFYSPHTDSMSWTFTADYLSTNGDTAIAAWNTAGIKNVIATATNTHGTTVDSLEVEIMDCAVSTFPHIWDFENRNERVCWTIMDVDGDDNTWYFYKSETYHYSPDSSEGIVYSAGRSYSANNWLISPAVQLPSGVAARMEWDAGPYSSSALYGELYGVYVSTTGTDISDFVWLSDFTFTEYAWNHPSVDLTPYAGQTIYLAFRHYNCNVNILMLDNISIQTGNAVTFNCTGLIPGEVYYTSNHTTNLCGQTDAVPTGFTASYDFFPSDDVNLDHLYVNNVDRIADVVTHSSGSSVSYYTYSFTVTGPTTVTPEFNYPFYPVTVDCAGDGLGYVYRTIDYNYEANLCGTIDTVRQGFIASYAFIPSRGNELTALYVNEVDRISDVYTYSSGSSVSINHYGFEPTAATTVRPVFSRIPYTITATSSDATMGMVTGGGTYYYDSTATFTATPMPHYQFLYWLAIGDGDTVVIDQEFLDEMEMETALNPLQLEIAGNGELIGVFGPEYYTITVTPNNPLYGSAAIEGSGTSFAYLEPVTVTATAYSGYHFAMWSNGATHNPYTFPASENLELTAIFLSDDDTTQYFSITVTSNNPEMGTVEGGGVFAMGDSVTIAAIPNDGYHFVQWQDGNTDNPRTIIATATVEYIAYFAETIEGIDGVTLDGATVYSHADRIYVTGAEGRSVKVFDISGRLVTRVDHATDALVFTLQHTGVYIVTVGKAAFRVVIK